MLSCLELGLACKIVYPEDLKPRALYSELVSLADMAKYVCGMELDKSQSESDWSKPVLTPEQLLCTEFAFFKYNADADVARFSQMLQRMHMCPLNVTRGCNKKSKVLNTTYHETGTLLMSSGTFGWR